MKQYKSYWIVFISLLLAIVMVDIDTTAINLAITTIIKDLGLSISQGQWIIDGYTMAAAVLMAFAGRVGDLFGYRKVLLYAYIVFIFASLIAGCAPNFSLLVLGRFIQGMCVAFTFPISIALVRVVFPKGKQGLAVSMLISAAGISQAIGPTFGGLMIEYASWRWIFLINVPLSLIAFYILYTFLGKQEQKKSVSLHYLTLVPLIVGLFSLMTAFNEVNQLGLLSVSFIGLLLLSIVSLTFFVYIEIHGKTPLLDLKLLLSEAFSSLLLVRFLVNFTYFSLLFGLGLVLRQALHYSAMDAGFIMLSLTVIIVVLALPVGKIIDKIGPLKPLLLGCVLMLLSCIALSFQSNYESLPALMCILFVAGVATSFLIPASTTAAMLSIPPEKTGAAMGVFATFGFLGNSLGVAISGSIIAHYLPLAGFVKAMMLCALFFLFAIGLTLNVFLKKK